MWKAAALIIFVWIQFSGRVGTTKCSQQNKTAKSSAERSWLVHQEAFSSKQHLWSRRLRHCSAPRWHSYQNKYGQKAADRPWTVEVPCTCTPLGKCHGTASSWNKKCWLREVRGLRTWRVLFLEDMPPLQQWSNLAEEIRFLEFFMNLI